MEKRINTRVATSRLFFALWPPDSLQRMLAALAQSLALETGGRAIAAQNIHLTAAFLGDIDNALIPSLLTIPRSFTVPLAISLDHVDAFKRGIVFIEPVAMPQGLTTAVAALHEALRGAGVDLEARPFKPHVTLVRQAKRRAIARVVHGMAWRATEFTLIRSLLGSAGAVYQRLSD